MGPSDKIAFVHLMRTGGVAVSGALCGALRRTHRLCDSWNEGLERDWTHEELLSFTESRTPIYVHNHAVSWNSQIVAAYRNAGFLLFTFVRPVGDQLCSLYHWCKQSEPGLDLGSLDQFLEQQLRGETVFGLNRCHWEIPYWWRSFAVCEVLTPESVDRLLRETLQQPDFASVVPANTSRNPGFDECYRRGDISAETLELLEQSSAERRFRELVSRYKLATAC